MAKSDLYSVSVQRISGESTTLEGYRGQVLLVVNVASQCGFTPQYAGLEALHQQYSAQGFAVLGFPCNQFGGQEPGDEATIQEFCNTRFNVTFPLFAKVEVNGAGAHPLFQLLKQAAPGILGSESIKWNFTKFLIDRAGEVKARYAPSTAPNQLTVDIERIL